jgi:hypothetical protein
MALASSSARISTLNLPLGAITAKPFFRIAAKCRSVTNRLTSTPARRSTAATSPPTPPAPTTQTFIESLPEMSKGGQCNFSAANDVGIEIE